MKTKDWILCIFSAILLILSFPKFNLWILAWFAFVPLFFALRNKSKFKAFLLSYFTGVIFWLGTIYWLVHVTFVGLVSLVLYLALYFGVFGLIITRQPLPVTRHLPFAIHHSLIFIPSVWVLLEYLRSHLFTGFGWGLLGYSQYLNLPVIQIADITGAWGISFLVMMVNVFLYKVMGYRLKVKGKDYLLAILFLVVSLFYGYYRLYLSPFTFHLSPIKISVIQGNIPQSIKWLDYAKEQIFERYLSLTSEALSDNPDVIIWPEAALPGVLNQDGHLKEKLKAFVGECGVPLLAGAVYSDKSAYYNSAILISGNGEIAKRYDKLHLVPFGEYVPVKDIFGFLETVVPIGDFVPGKEYTVFSLATRGATQDARRTAQDARRFSVLICFEDIFPQISRGFVKKGADFLVNITNDAWFGDTSSPYQHLQASVFRAVENGVYLVRAANTGISGFISPYGEVRTLVDEDTGSQTFISGYKTYDIALSRRQNTFYTEWGDWFVLVCLIIAIYGALKVKG